MNLSKIGLVFLTLGICAMDGVATATSGFRVTDLRCEYRRDPVGIDSSQPRLSWTLETTARGQRQTAYRVLVSESLERLSQSSGDLWDSGRVDSGQSVHVVYGGRPLRSRARCFWKVQVWDKDGRELSWSDAATWTMGLLRPEDWRGLWMSTPRARSLDHKSGLSEKLLGYHSDPRNKDQKTKWVQMDLGEKMPIDSVVLHPLDYGGIQGYGFPIRFRVDVSDDPDFKKSTVVANHSEEDYPNPGHEVRVFEAGGAHARYVRMTALRLWRDPEAKRQPCFGLAEVEVMREGRNIGRTARLSDGDGDGDSVKTEGGLWDKSCLNDGKGRAPGAPRITETDEGEDPGDAAILMRRQMRLDKPVRRAVACICGLGASELYINGEKVSDDVLAPGIADYTIRVPYMVYDVTDRLREGDNAIGVILGNYFYSLPSVASPQCKWFFRGNTSWGGWPKLLLDIHVEHTDGSATTIASDEKWKWCTNDITWNCLWTGEKIDRRLAKPGWSTAAYDDGNWKPVLTVKGPQGRLEARQNPPIRVFESVFPLDPKKKQRGLDFGATYTGWIRVKARGEAGQKITTPGCEFVLGGGIEAIEPRFTFRTIASPAEVNGPPGVVEEAVLRRVGADLQTAGEFSCSNEYFNRLHEVLLRTHRNYSFDIPMDPTREYSGWTQDVETMFETAAYLTDVATLYTKWWRDMKDNQDEQGYLSPVVPFGGWDVGRRQLRGFNGPWWSGMIVLTPWLMYQYYGDTRLLEEAYPAMKKYIDYLGAAGRNGLLTWGLGDWREVGSSGSPQRTPRVVTGTCAYYYYADIVSRTAGILDRPADREKYAALADRIRKAFVERLLDRETGVVGKAMDSQTALLLPLYLDMAPDAARHLVLERLIENIHQRKDHLSTGFVGTPYLLRSLSDFGHAEMACAIANQRDFPGWTTLTQGGVFKETWDGGMVQMPSCGGAIGAWFYQCLAGLRPDPSGPGFKKIVIRPDVVGDLTWVKAHYDSLYGRIASHWRLEGDRLIMEVTIPANTTATVCVPARNADAVLESDIPAAQAECVRFLRMENGRALFDVGSGVYRFESKGYTKK